MPDSLVSKNMMLWVFPAGLWHTESGEASLYIWAELKAKLQLRISQDPPFQHEKEPYCEHKTSAHPNGSIYLPG